MSKNPIKVMSSILTGRIYVKGKTYRLEVVEAQESTND